MTYHLNRLNVAIHIRAPITSGDDAVVCCHRKTELLALLMGGCNSAGAHSNSVLRPLWANEEMHRAYAINRLFQGITTQSVIEDDSVETSSEFDAACKLVTCFRSLAIVKEAELVPCSETLRETARLLVEVLGAGAGNISIQMLAVPLMLPAYQRRALVLLMCELVMNSLLHAFHGRTTGRILVELSQVGAAHARLRVLDDGVWADRTINSDCGAVSRDLADLLGSDLTYLRAARHWTIAEVDFRFR